MCFEIKKIYFTITETKSRYEHDFMKSGMKVRLSKEPVNHYDKEAIRVEMKSIGYIGYVSNSICTVKGES